MLKSNSSRKKKRYLTFQLKEKYYKEASISGNTTRQAENHMGMYVSVNTGDIAH